MTIDEAIENLKYDIEIDMYIRDIAPQIVEWLELLKWYDQGMEYIPSESGVLPKDVYHAAYNKAINDYADKLNAKCDEIINVRWNSSVAPISWAEAYADFKDDIDETAEQLKAGIGNGIDNQQ